MKLPSHALIALAILFFVGTLSQRASSQIKTESKTAEATVSGKVTIKGKPASGIVVGMRLSRPEELSSTYKTRTDQDGVYRISRVGSGNYLVAPVAPAYVIADFANGAQGQSVVITESENVEGINFDLVPGGVVTGKVTDSEGHALIEERVSLMPADDRDQRRPFYGSTSGMITDDRGVYRIFGVPAGRYKVSVGDPRFNTGNRRRAMVQTFYPDVTDFAKAGVVEVKEGSDANKIDITIGEGPQGYSVAGQVVDGESGTPIGRVYIQLSRIEVSESGTRHFSENVDVQSDAQGQFRLRNVRPGKYDLTIYTPEDSNARLDAPVRFDVFDQDVSGLVVKTSKGATIAGIIVVEGSKGSSATPPPQMWLGVYTRGEGPNSNVNSNGSARVKPDGTFFAGGLLAGIANFNVEVMNNKGFNLTRIERDGVPQPNGIQIQNGEHISGVRLVMTFSNGSIRGVVRIENGTLPPTARISVQMMKAGEQSPFQRGVEVDARGHFLIEGLAAGSYELRASVYSPEMQRQRIRPPMSEKQIVIVNDGAAAEVTLTLDLTPSPNQ